MAHSVRLGDVANVLTGFPFKSAQFTSDASDPFLLRGDNIGQGTLRWDGAKRWPAGDVPATSPYWLRMDDVVVAMDRPWIEAGLKFAAVRDHDVPALLVQRVARLRGTSQLDVRFLRYVIGSKGFTDYVLGVQTGTAVPHISRAQIEGFEFSLPSMQEQRAIASILGALDDKIEVNRKMSATLEAMARALFKSWFVDFDPVRAKAEGRDPGLASEVTALFPDSFEESELGKIPKGWAVRGVGDIADIVGGSTPKTAEPSYWDGPYAWATPKDLASLDTPVLVSTQRTITKAGLSTISSGLLPVGTVLLSSRAPIGYLAVADIPVAINQGFIAMKPRAQTSNLFLLRWAQYAHEAIVARANGSTFLEISKTNFRPIPVIVPPGAIMQTFDAAAKSLHQRLVCADRESHTLAALRDALLPKLISGEICVTKAERIVEKSA